MTDRLPGIQGLEDKDWILVDDAKDGQFAYADWLLANETDRTFASSNMAACEELLEHVSGAVMRHPDYENGDGYVIRPDGMRIDLDADHPLIVARRLVQQDWCIMMNGDGTTILSDAALCFPASWALEEKFQKPLVDIHMPVHEYDDGVAKRVQRLFDAMREGRMLWRANYQMYRDADLFQPRREDTRRSKDVRDQSLARIERQSLRLLPKSGATVFGIHTYVVPLANLPKDAADALVAKVKSRHS